MTKEPKATVKEVQTFYRELMLDFFQRLEQQDHSGDYPRVNIGKLMEITGALLRKPEELLRMKYRQQKKQEEQEMKRNQKQEEQQKAEQQAVEVKVQDLENPVKQDQQHLEQQFQEEDPGARTRPLHHHVKAEEPKIKIEEPEAPLPEVIKDETDVQGTYDDAEYEARNLQKDETIRRANEEVGMLIVAQSVPSTKKYIAKTDKTKITLKDAFVKYIDREEFYKQIMCEFTKIEGHNIQP